MFKAIVLIGPPGSGKGSHCSGLQHEFMLSKVVMGDLVRSKLRDASDSGSLVNDIVVNELFLEAYNNLNKDKNIIIDGYPRNMEQVAFFKTLVPEENLIVFYLEVDYNVLSKRILGRISCKDCGEVFNLYFKPTLKLNVCDVCGSANIFKRNDDNEQVLHKRIDEYKTHSLPVIDYYKRLGLAYKVDANLSLREVSLEVLNLAKRLLTK